MKVTGEMVRDLQQRVDVTYEEAERVLIRTKGNLEEAETILKRRKESRLNSFGNEVSRIYRELLTYYVKIKRKGKTVLDMPLVVLLGLYLIMTTDSKIWVGVVTIGIILITESTVSIYRVDREEERIVSNKPQKKAKEPQTKKEEKSTEVPVKTDNTNKDDDDDYYEITIEK